MDLQTMTKNIARHERLDRAYEMIEALKAKAHPGGMNLDGMPRGTDVSDKVGNLAIQIADLSARIAQLEDETEAADDAIREFANSFEDERVQQAIQAHFISCFSWNATAELLGPKYTGKGIRKTVIVALHKREATGG